MEVAVGTAISVVSTVDTEELTLYVDWSDEKTLVNGPADTDN